MKTPGFSKKQDGFALVLSAVLALTVSTALMTLYIDGERKVANKQKAIEAGVELRSFSYGVMRLISESGNTITPGVFVGTSWLKASDCSISGSAFGTASEAFLPCSFPDKNRYRDDYTTEITVSGDNVDATISIPWPEVLGVQSAIAAASLRTIAASDSSQIGGMGVTVTPAVLGWLTFKDVSETQVTKTIEATASNNSALDVWLRTDGSNSMNANLDMNSNSIDDIRDLEATGQATVGSLSVSGGSFDSIFTQGGVFVTGDIISEGEMRSFDDLTIGNGGDSSINFLQSSNSSQNVSIRAEGRGDVVITNGNGDAQLIADRFYIKGVNRFASQGVYNMTIVGQGGDVDIIACPASTVPQVFTAVSGLSQRTAAPIYSYDVVTTTDGSKWTFTVEVISSTGRVPPSSIQANILVAVKCS
jgi:hypothetical protein